MQKDRCRVAVMDLGSQTFRIAGAEVKDGRPRVLFSLRNNIRMGQSLMAAGVFSPDAMDRGISCLKDFLNVIDQHGIRRFRAIATEAFRKAKNAEAFSKRAEALGINIEVISPLEEATLAVKGAYLTLDSKPAVWIMTDCGGGSTEVVVCQGQKITSFKSMDIGAVTLSEEFLENKSKGIGHELRLLARKIIGGELASFKELAGRADVFVATGGTATTIASVSLGLSAYDPSKVRGFQITYRELEKLYQRLLSMDVEKRREIKGLEPERADIFPAGIAILLEVIRYLGLRKLIISDGGILLGLLSAFMEKECKLYAESSRARGLYL